MRKPWTLCLIALLSVSLQSGATTIYKWTDDQGRLHYASQPPANYPAEVITTNSFTLPESNTAAADATDEVPSQTAATPAARKPVVIDSAELRTHCSNLRHSLAQLKSNPRLLAEVDGKHVRLTEEERQQRIATATEQLEEYCQGY